MKLKINKELHSLIPPLNQDEYDTLETLLLREGIRDPLVVWDGIIVDGHNRYKIAKEWGIEFDTVEKDFGNIEQAKDWMDENQLGRRNLTADQRKIVIGRRYNREKKQGERNDLTSGQNGTKLPASEKLAKKNNISPRTVKRYAKEAENFEKLKEEKPDVANNIWSGNSTLKEYKKQERKRKREEIKQEQHSKLNDLKESQKTKSILEKEYRVIYADPPWEYGNNMPDYFSEQADHYLLMKPKEIEKLEIGNRHVSELAIDNAVLFLWCTSPILPEALDVLDAWGFQYKSTFIWDKIKHNMGHYNSVRHEILLIGVRGSCQPDVRKLFDSVQSIDRTKHSEKPEKFREIIDHIYPKGDRIELFSRKEIRNWDCYGLEV